MDHSRALRHLHKKINALSDKNSTTKIFNKTFAQSSNEIMFAVS